MAPGGDFIQSIYLSGWSFNYVDLLLLPVGLQQTTGCCKARTTELLVYDSELDPLLIEFVDVMMTNGDDKCGERDGESCRGTGHNGLEKQRGLCGADSIIETRGRCLHRTSL